MGFQDNSGDIILDVVLTDEGRKRLAKADGSFEIVKFACGDDEINYSLYNLNTGSAYQDLSILQTPVLEAFTNNASSMKSMLVSIPRTNILFMPILRLNEKQVQTQVGTYGSFIVAVDADTQDNSAKSLNTSIGYVSNSHQQGVLFGNNPEIEVSSFIKVDAGIDGGSLIEVPADLSETQFMIQMDHRLGSLVDTTGKTFITLPTTTPASGRAPMPPMSDAKVDFTRFLGKGTSYTPESWYNIFIWIPVMAAKSNTGIGTTPAPIE